MKKNVVAPSVGESITEVSILKWARKDGEAVKVGDLLMEIESDKATVEVVAENAGTLKIGVPAGERVAIGAVLGFIDDSIAATATSAAAAAPAKPATPQATPSTPASTTPSAAAHAASAATSAPGAHPGLSPAVRRASAQHGVDPSTIAGSGKDGRVTKGDVMGAVAGAATTAPQAARPASPPPAAPAASTMAKPAYIDQPGDRRVPMSMLRQKIAERLVYAQHTAAILTTFNEVDMSVVMKLRAEHKDKFKAKHGVNLSFMSFFAKGVISALKAIPEVNATIDGKDIVYHDYFDIGVAVGTERGLVVPIVRGADQLDVVGIEKKIAEFAVKARDGKLNMADMAGGTFTISNGGTYGSLMSTPILNPPQSGILGMHKIMDRPMAVNGKVEIRPMMYLALSYDHRIIDGKGAVTFLVHLKEFLESAEKINLTY